MARPIINILCWAVFLSMALLSSPLAAFSAEPPMGMFELYAENRANNIPNYITEDFLFLAYGLTLEKAVTDREKNTLRPQLVKLISDLLEKYQANDQTDETVRANRNFLSLLAALLEGLDHPAGAADPDLVAAELEKVIQAKELTRSDLVRQTIDYTQFKIRGHYSGDEELGRYFRAVKYAGTVLFPIVSSQATGISPEDADRLTGQALDLVRTMAGDQTLLQGYQSFNDQLGYIFGPSEDLTLADYRSMDQEQDLAQIRASLFELAKTQGRQPAIVSAVVNQALLEQGLTARDVVTGWRFFPQRFTPDSAAFQQLVFDKVTVYTGKKDQPFSLAPIRNQKVKGFPLGLELMALLGSKAAAEKLRQNDEQSYTGYSQAWNRALELISTPSGLPSEHLALMAAWLKSESVDPGRGLNTCLGFWTRLRHTSLLYAKQSYTAAGKGLSMDKGRSSAWLEPAAPLYRNLGELARQAAEGLNSKDLTSLAGLLDRCGRIAEDLGQGREPGRDDAGFLNGLDLEILRLTGGPDLPVATDVHTEPNNNLVLEEALGPPVAVYHPIQGTRARGALFNYYEFKYDLSQRLSDEEWQNLLNDKNKMDFLQISPGSTAWKN